MKISHFDEPQQALYSLRETLKQGDIVLLKGEKKESLEKVAKAMSDRTSENRLYINFSAIRSNLSLIRTRLAKGMRIMVMVKAQGYGTHHLMLGNFLGSCGVDILGVAHIDEAISLREGGIKQALFVINVANYEIEKLIKYNFEVGISDLSLAEELAKEAFKKNVRVKCHLHVDTGMGRFGCRKEEALNLAKLITASSHLELVGVMTHLAASEESAFDSFTLKQREEFEEVILILRAHGINPPFIHACNSSGALRFAFPFCNMVRLGLAPLGMLGGSHQLPLKLALSLHSRIAGINLCKEGESVSYGRTYSIRKQEEKIAVIPLGYFDGLHQQYSGKGHVLIRGHKAPMVGKICMDYMMCNVSEIPDVNIGDPVLIFGEDFHGNRLLPQELASWGDTDVRELITCLGPRIQRIFIDDEI